MAHSSRAKLRASVTGEPYALAVQWISAHGLHDGLVPDAQSPSQQLAEAAVLAALARPRVLPVLAPAGTLYALEGTEPSSDRLILRPAGDHAAAVLARLLPAEAGGRISGMPLLRTGKVTNTTIAFRLPGATGMESVQLAIRATRAHRQQAEQLQDEVGLTPLWNGPEGGAAELAAWRDHVHSLSDSRALWSRALRRPALFRLAHPDWGTSAPTEDEVTGSVDPSRLAPRSVDPQPSSHGPRRAPLVAVTADAGGTGGTTVALGVAAGLARRGLNTAVILEPGTLQGQLNEHIADTNDDWAVLACPAPGRLEAAARQTTTLRQQLRAAQERADVVVIDPTGSTRGVSLPVDPDVTLAIPPEKSVWGAWLWTEHQKLDHRPPKVRMAAWLSERFERFTRRYQQAHPPAPAEVLLRLLDERFLLVAVDRTGETTGEYVDLYTDVAAEPEDLEEWWTPNSPDFECHPDEALPEEPEAVLDVWRTEFLRQMQPEGRQRFGPVWDAAAAAWPARNRTRHRLGLHPMAMAPETAEPIRRAFLQEVAAEAAEQWGDRWPGHGRIWAEAAADGQDLTVGWEDRIEIRPVPRAPEAIAADVASVLVKSTGFSPKGTTILVRNQVRRDDRGSAEQLAAVATHLAESGITALCEIPSDMKVREAAGKALLTPRDGLAEAFDRLAELAARGL